MNQRRSQDRERQHCQDHWGQAYAQATETNDHCEDRQADVAEIGDVETVADQVEKGIDRFDQNTVQTPAYYQVLNAGGQIEKEEGRQGIGEKVHPVK